MTGAHPRRPLPAADRLKIEVTDKLLEPSPKAQPINPMFLLVTTLYHRNCR